MSSISSCYYGFTEYDIQIESLSFLTGLTKYFFLTKMASKKDKSIRKKRNIISPPLHPSDQWISIGSGNYKGNWNHRTMSGNGVYVMFDGNY